MRFSLTQIDALSKLQRDPGAALPKRVLQALRHRGLVDENDHLNELGRQAISELRLEQRAGPAAARRKETTRIHLDNEPATLAQLRLLERLWGVKPDGLSKHDASLLITFVQEQRRGAADICEERLAVAADLIEAGAQAADAIAFSDQGPFRGGDRQPLQGYLARIIVKRKTLDVVIGVRVPEGASLEDKPTRLWRRGDVPVTKSKARTLFENLAQRFA